MKPRVFLSHSKADRAHIDKIATDLKSAQLDVWYDDWEIPPGASLRSKIFDDGIAKCDLFFAYLTPHSVSSRWVREELDAAFVREFESRAGFLALFVDSEETRASLGADLRARKIPVIGGNSYAQGLAQICTQAWKAASERKERERKEREREIELVRVFKDRTDLLSKASFGDSISGARTFEIVAFSANVLLSHEDHVREILSAGARLRVVLYDPGPATTVFYSSLAPDIDGNEKAKREEADVFNTKLQFWREKIATGEYTGSIDVKWLTGKSLYYNLWLRDRGLETEIGNLSVYSYRGRKDTPVFRADRGAKGFLAAMASEFDYVWKNAKDNPSWN